ncbi:MAG: BolA/IbaG family iron-sulfur metabolism protein [Rhodocyclaceae bacterium]|nr:BolA/IbaG family iron-sulfur metabolism protein [Rhodocyclaceae bacterium]
MLDPRHIEDWIRAELDCTALTVSGDGRHFEAVIVSPAFAGLSRIERQRRVNAILRPHFESDTLHALSMRCLTPEEAGG